MRTREVDGGGGRGGRREGVPSDADRRDLALGRLRLAAQIAARSSSANGAGHPRRREQWRDLPARSTAASTSIAWPLLAGTSRHHLSLLPRAGPRSSRLPHRQAVQPGRDRGPRGLVQRRRGRVAGRPRPGLVAADAGRAEGCVGAARPRRARLPRTRSWRGRGETVDPDGALGHPVRHAARGGGDVRANLDHEEAAAGRADPRHHERQARRRRLVSRPTVRSRPVRMSAACWNATSRAERSTESCANGWCARSCATTRSGGYQRHAAPARSPSTRARGSRSATAARPKELPPNTTWVRPSRDDQAAPE